jgi:hypothetical protein
MRRAIRTPALASVLSLIAITARAQQAAGFGGINLGMSFVEAATVAEGDPWMRVPGSMPFHYVVDSSRLDDERNTVGCEGLTLKCQAVQDIILSTYDWGDTNLVLRFDITSPIFTRNNVELPLAWIAAAREFLTKRYGAPTLLHTPEDWAENDVNASFVPTATTLRPLYEWRVDDDLITLYGMWGAGLSGRIKFERLERK